MSKRVRLLIYEGSPEWLENQRQHDGVQRNKFMSYGSKFGNCSIRSIELDPWRITVLELLRVLFRREGR